MSAIVNKILSLSDPHITAAFQDICGIKTIPPVCAKKSECNGVISKGNAGHNVAGSTSLNGSVSKISGHDSQASKAGTNGLNSNYLNSSLTENHISKESESRNRKLLHKNGYLKKLENGHVPNGVSKTLNDRLTDEMSKANGHVSSIETKEETQETPQFTINNYFLYYVFSFGASLGNEVFYVLFFSTSLWNFDNYVTRRMLILWGSIMYIGQALKDVIRWPRPHAPPAIWLETRYELEYGMPSTHAMVAVAIPFGMLCFMVERYEFNLFFGVLFAVNWCILVSFSRLYLGMHSALDILAGVVGAAIMMVIGYNFVDQIDKFIIGHPYGGPVLVAVSLLGCLMYPSLDKWSTARGDTTISVAVFSGCEFGLWMTRMLTEFVPEQAQLPYYFTFPGIDHVWGSIQRQMIGVTIVVIVLSTLRIIMLRLMCWIWGLDPKDPMSKRTLRVELPYKFTAYFTASAVATYLMPVLFSYLNIMRQSYYSELFTV